MYPEWERHVTAALEDLEWWRSEAFARRWRAQRDEQLLGQWVAASRATLEHPAEADEDELTPAHAARWHAWRATQ